MHSSPCGGRQIIPVFYITGLDRKRENSSVPGVSYWSLRPTLLYRWSLSKPLPQRFCRAATCNLGSRPVPTVVVRSSRLSHPTLQRPIKAASISGQAGPPRAPPYCIAGLFRDHCRSVFVARLRVTLGLDHYPLITLHCTRHTVSMARAAPALQHCRHQQ